VRRVPPHSALLLARSTEKNAWMERCDITFGIVYLGDHNVTGSVRRYRGEESYHAAANEIGAAFASGDVPEVWRYNRSAGLPRAC